MDRRNFLKLSALAGLGLTAPTLVRDGRAQAERYDGPYWALVHAAGGWDPRFMFDPIATGDQNRLYTDAGAVGNIPCADFAVDPAAFNLNEGEGLELLLMSPRQFLERWGSRLTVFNGVDTSTNNHDAGTRTIWSGTIPGQYPSFGALVAAARAPEQPMAFLSGGGYDVTDGLVPLARVGNPDILVRVAHPNVIDPTNGNDPEYYHTPATMRRIIEAQHERLTAMRGAQRLPKWRRSMEDLQIARLGVSDLARLHLPSSLVDIPGGGLGDLERMMRQSQLAIAGFQAGMTVTSTITLGGFDTHGDHDRDQPRQVAKLLKGLDFLLSEATAAGIIDKLYVVVASDFARGPFYNSDRDNAGKDHWPITSLLAMGPGIPGDRVIGATDGEQHALRVDPGNLTPADNGAPLNPEVIHRALRRTAGIEGLGDEYPLAGQDLALFG